MLREAVAAMVKFFGMLLVLTTVWVGAGEYQRKNFKSTLEEAVRVRVRAECVRPDSIQTETQAREYDLTLRELDLISEKTELLNKRTNAMLDHVERIEALRAEMVQNRSLPALGGVGGPGPSPKKH